MDMLGVGAAWRWTGTAVRIDAPGDVLLLTGAEGETDMRQKAARMVRRLIGVAVRPEAAALAQDDLQDLPDQCFSVTDGQRCYTVTLLPVPASGARLLMFHGAPPPQGRDLWILRVQIDRSGAAAAQHASGGVICFSPGTRILTPSGPQLIETLRPGDLILTKDNGPQELLWRGSRRMSGARLHAMPHLRPIRFRAGALGQGRPDGDLWVSPQHRMLVKGRAARSLFNSDEVLIAAKDLVDHHHVLIDHSLREVTYIHLMLEQHNILFANGLETESFHPSNAALETLAPPDREGLLQLLPALAQNPYAYGDHARRTLTGSEAAILRFDSRAA
ncbi:Hint domain-containing protein [Pseudogemmobacter lacusdianii]|nr:Hint domain-containing protein [Xinfangfangia sp. CPCC 101601]